MSLQQVIMMVLSGQLALGPLVFYVFERSALHERVPARWRRLAIAGAATLLGLLIWGLGMFLGYVPTPPDRTALAESLWNYGVLFGGSAFGSSQILHGLLKKVPHE